MLIRRLREPWILYLFLGLLAVAGYFTLPPSAGQSFLYDLIGLSAMIAIAVGIWWHRPTPLAPWVLLMLGDAFAVAGDLLWFYDQQVRGAQTPFPSLADGIYLAGTLLICAGALILAHAHTGGRDRASLIDTAILATGGGLILWVFLIDPQWENTSRPLLARLVATAYPTLDLLILAAVLRVALSAGGRTVALRLLVLALGILCVSNVAYAILLARADYYTGHPIAIGWLLAYVLHGTMGLHPSLRIRPGPVSADVGLSRGRLLLLALAALTGPALLAIQEVRNARIDVPVIVVASVALFLLALGRLHLLAVAGREREARFRALVQRAADGVAIVDAQGQALYQSPAVSAIIGYAPDEVLGRDVFARIHPDDQDAAWRLFRELLSEAGLSRVRDLRVQHADGSWRVLEVRGTNLLDNPAVGGIVINYRDRTERAQAEAARQASERQLRAQYDGFPLPTVTWRRQDDDFVLVDFNSAAIPFTDGKIASLVGTTCRTFNRERPGVVADFERCYAERATLHREYTSHPAGTAETRQLFVTYAFVPPDMVMLHTEDITERLRAEVALRTSEANLAEAQRISQVGSWEHDLVTGELHWSDEVFRIVGQPPRAFVPSPERATDAIHPEDRDLLGRARHASLTGGPAYSVEHRIVRPDGEVRLVRQQAELIRDASGQAIKRVGVVQDVTERRALEARLRHQAFHDLLTGLPNRALLLDRLGQALARASRSEHGTCAVLLLDLDRFKTVNDSLGHAAGDRLLVAATARLRGALRDGDTLARLGGDEFVVLLDDIADLTEALRIAERLHAALHAPLMVEGRALFATASIGVALRSGPGDTPEDLLRFADVALYRAKEAGRACTEAFYPGMSAATLERLELEHDLRLALERDEFVSYYQPKVDLATGAVVGLEALVRWQHPTRGLVPPGEFIPLAEETGLIAPIGRWMLAEACRQLVAWQRWLPGQVAPFVSVNLSARQFRNPDLAAEIAEVLAETGLAPKLLTLEVTETVAMARPEASAATLRALKGLGVKLVLDDFGTGYSSLAYLQQLPVDGMKIDRAFFKPGERNRVIVRAVAALARGLGLDVTAEGLETPEQVAWACEVGCDRGQGFYFSRPVPAEEIEALWALGLTFDLPQVEIVRRRSAGLVSVQRVW